MHSEESQRPFKIARESCWESDIYVSETEQEYCDHHGKLLFAYV